MSTATGDIRELRIDCDEALSDFRRRLRSPGFLPDKVVLDPAFVAGSRSRTQQLERRMNRSLADCGCDAGAAAVVVAATSLAIRRLRSGGGLGVEGAARGAAVVAGTAVLGKVAGLAYHRAVLLRLSASIASPKGSLSATACGGRARGGP